MAKNRIPFWTNRMVYFGYSFAWPPITTHQWPVSKINKFTLLLAIKEMDGGNSFARSLSLSLRSRSTPRSLVVRTNDGKFSAPMLVGCCSQKHSNKIFFILVIFSVSIRSQPKKYYLIILLKHPLRSAELKPSGPDIKELKVTRKKINESVLKKVDADCKILPIALVVSDQNSDSWTQKNPWSSH